MATTLATPCEHCGRLYNHRRLRSCPGCQATEGSGKYLDPLVGTPEYETQRLLKELLRSTNRTTYAVRAGVSLTVYLLITAGLVWILILLAGLLASVSPDGILPPVLIFISWIVGLVGTYLAYKKFYEEWKASEVPVDF